MENTYQQICIGNNIWYSIAIIIIGNIDLILQRKTLGENVKFIHYYLESLSCFITNLDNSNAKEFVLTNRRRMAKITTNYYEPSNICECIEAGQLAKARHHAKLFINTTQELCTEKEKEHKQLKNDFFNPFTLFYRGIKLSLQYTIGYLVKLFHNDIDFETNKYWNQISRFASVIGILGFIYSILKDYVI